MRFLKIFKQVIYSHCIKLKLKFSSKVMTHQIISYAVFYLCSCMCTYIQKYVVCFAVIKKFIEMISEFASLCILLLLHRFQYIHECVSRLFSIPLICVLFLCQLSVYSVLWFCTLWHLVVYVQPHCFCSKTSWILYISI